MTKLYKDKDWLYDQYWNKNKSTVKMGEECEVASTVIVYWMKKYNIPRRTQSESAKIFADTIEFKRKMSKLNSGKNNPNWRGGIHKNKKGYRQIYKPDHPRANCLNRVLEHILVAEKMLRRPLKYFGKNHSDNEIVHHIDHNKANNSPENLDIETNKQHTKTENSFMKIGFELAKKQFDKGNIIYNKKTKRYELK